MLSDIGNTGDEGDGDEEEGFVMVSLFPGSFSGTCFHADEQFSGVKL